MLLEEVVSELGFETGLTGGDARGGFAGGRECGKARGLSPGGGAASE